MEKVTFGTRSFRCSRRPRYSLKMIPFEIACSGSLGTQEHFQSTNERSNWSDNYKSWSSAHPHWRLRAPKPRCVTEGNSIVLMVIRGWRVAVLLLHQIALAFISDLTSCPK